MKVPFSFQKYNIIMKVNSTQLHGDDSKKCRVKSRSYLNRPEYSVHYSLFYLQDINMLVTISLFIRISSLYISQKLELQLHSNL